MKGMPGMSGGMAQLMKQANQMQLKMKKAQEEIAKMEFDGTSGGGAVTVKVSGAHLLISITIDPEVLKAGDTEMTQDMIVTASNDAIKKAKEYSEKEMGKITGGMGIPGMF
jgi:DNA-binding YbaB/EbfC family protein